MTAEKIDAFFDACDADEDGKVTRDELREKMTDGGMEEDAIEAVFKYADLNGDGDITKEELTKAMFAQQWEVLFDRLDVDDDGTLSVEEIKGLLEDAEDVDPESLTAFMEANDISEDGRLSKEEFCNWIGKPE